MAEIKGFRGLRYTQKAGQMEELVCPPYDIISEEERLSFLQKNPHNVIRLELPRGENPYAEAGSALQSWLSGGIVAQDDAASIYVYEEEFTVKSAVKKIKGVIAAVKLEEFEKGVVLPHEFTLSKAKTDRFNLMKATGCNFSQIYSLYMDEQKQAGAIMEACSKGAPEVEITDADGLIHRLWAIRQPEDIDALTKAFADKVLYIADGHHRYETALNYRNACRQKGVSQEGDNQDYVMMMLVDMAHEGLVVLPTHRLIRDLSSFDSAALLEKCRPYFDITEKTNLGAMEAELETLYKENKKAFGFYAGSDTWMLLVLKDISVLDSRLPDMSQASRHLDVTVLHTLILEELLGIDKENMANQINLTYVKKQEDALESVRTGKAQCAFILNPTRVEEIRDVASCGEKMPQKSTYFYPKLITGLVMNRF